MERAQHPPGMRLITEEERLETLAMLLNTKTEAFSEYNRLPIAANTMTIRAKRTELEQ